MIFVIHGTEAFPFDRMAKEIDALKGDGTLTDDVFMQLGSCTYEPKHCKFERYLSFGEMRENIAAADLVISHAGAGSTLLCLEIGKRPIIVTRQHKHNEHVDDHQIPFAKMMEKRNYVVVAYDPSELRDCIAKVLSPDHALGAFQKDNRLLVNYLSDLADAYGDKTSAPLERKSSISGNP
jgi:UDP-N-acetylglucosamine transferase subunit ALG13